MKRGGEPVGAIQTQSSQVPCLTRAGWGVYEVIQSTLMWSGWLEGVNCEKGRRWTVESTSTKFRGILWAILRVNTHRGIFQGVTNKELSDSVV